MRNSKTFIVRTTWIALVLVLFLNVVEMLPGEKIYAQSILINPGEVIVYQRSAERASEIVHLSSDSRQIYRLPLDKCTAISPDGESIAQSSLQNDDLIVGSVNPQAIIIQSVWQNNWATCEIIWISNTVFAIRQINAQQDFLYFDVSGGNLTPFEFEPPASTEHPPLPNWIPSTENSFILQSPHLEIVLYESCTDGQLTTNERFCVSTDFVIYNSAQQHIIHILDNPDEGLIRGFDLSSGKLLSYGGAVWSADGRYLAFQSNLISNSPYEYFNLQIFDVVEGEYLNTDWVNAEIDSFKAMQWTANGDKLLFWVVGRFGEPESGDETGSLRTPAIFDASTGKFKAIDEAFDFRPGAIEAIGTWSPDGSGYAFVDLNGTLFHIDANTGQVTILDTFVSDLLAWKIYQ